MLFRSPSIGRCISVGMELGRDECVGMAAMAWNLKGLVVVSMGEAWGVVWASNLQGTGLDSNSLRAGLSCFVVFFVVLSWWVGGMVFWGPGLGQGLWTMGDGLEVVSIHCGDSSSLLSKSSISASDMSILCLFACCPSLSLSELSFSLPLLLLSSEDPVFILFLMLV